jgi:hypothetical protein
MIDLKLGSTNARMIATLASVARTEEMMLENIIAPHSVYAVG